MNGSDPERLISLYLLNRTSMTPEQVTQLSGWLTQDPSHVRHYLESVRVHSMIREYFSANDAVRKAMFEEGSADMDPAVLEDELMQLLVMEKRSPSLGIRRSPIEEAEKPVERSTVPPAKPKVSRFWLSISVASVAAILLLVIWITVVPPRPMAVATLLDSLEAQWLTSDPGPLRGHRFLDDGQPLRLAKGFAKLSFDSGAELLVQGPSEIKVHGLNRVALSYGTVCTRVPESARGFRVDAPHYGVVDLGTEFGMEVGVDGTARVLMYKGKASLVPQEGGPSEPNVFIAEGQARRIQMDGRIDPTEIEPDRFVRAFNGQSGLLWRGEPVNLADVVGRGNGLGTGQRHWGVHFYSGLIVPMTFGPSRPGPVDYIRAKGCPFIDGVFSPGGNGLPTEVSSMHHVWKDCPRTSGVLPMGPCLDGPVGLGENPLMLNGVQYGVSRHPALFMHSNAGITFDLRAIRKFYRDLHRGLTPTGFKTLAGLSDTVLTQGPGQMERPPVAGLWILVDGQTRWKKTDLAGGADPIRIDVPLEPDAAFLTIVVTEGEDQALSGDWVVLGDPVIALSCD